MLRIIRISVIMSVFAICRAHRGYMPSNKIGLSSGSNASVTLRIAAGAAVLATHFGAGALLFMASETKPQLLEQEAIMVSVIEAPVAEQAKGEPLPAEPVVETPPKPSTPEPPPPEPEVKPPPPEPEPEPKPPPEPTPAPPPKPKPAPAPKPKPTPKVAPAPNPTPTPPTPPKLVTGVDDGAKRNQAPQVGPKTDEPITLSSVEYRGQRPVPTYPRMSQRLREEGTTIVLVEIDTEGNVTRASISKSSGFERLDEAALEAARKARFTPAKVGGVARFARANLPFNFVLRN